ncbi:hypothetical protein TYRP_009746 [Tyrophagus putrescentiae]|nr:hypothetical protein TYRP_009746 [Tyrophagus putrescentiae]
MGVIEEDEVGEATGDVLHATHLVDVRALKGVDADVQVAEFGDACQKVTQLTGDVKDDARLQVQVTEVHHLGTKDTRAHGGRLSLQIIILDLTKHKIQKHV